METTVQDELFELVLYPADSVAEFDVDTYEYSQEYREIVSNDLRFLDFTVTADDLRGISVGYGADGPALLLTLTGAVGFFLQGKNIEDNIDAWVRLGKRLIEAIRRLKQRRGNCSVSEPVALAMTMAHLALNGADTAQITVISRTTCPVPNGSLGPAYMRVFSSQPDRYYVFAIAEGRENLHVVGMSSDGQILFQHVLTLDHFQFPPNAAQIGASPTRSEHTSGGANIDVMASSDQTTVIQRP